MTRLAAALGVFIILTGLFAAISPETLISFVVDGPPSMQYYAGGARLGIGLILVLAAGKSRFPTVLKVLGGLTIVGGLTLLLISPDVWAKMIGWVSENFVHIGAYRFFAAVAGILLGAFIVYATLTTTEPGDDEAGGR